jgi:hypothetical protein
MAREHNTVIIEVIANQRSTAWVAAAECLARYSQTFQRLELLRQESCSVVPVYGAETIEYGEEIPQPKFKGPNLA